MKPLPPELRATIIELDAGMCAWPGCDLPATEIAHLHSRGMDGTPDGRRDDPRNLMCACWVHARYTDGDPAGGSWAAYADALYRLLGRNARHAIAHPNRLAYEVAETLRAHLERTRSWAVYGQPTPAGGRGDL